VKRGIAFFDFDGTITSRDTLLEFIRFSKGSFHFWLGFFLNSPYILAYKLKIISNQKAKEKVLSFFFKQTPLVEFQKVCDEFSSQHIPKLVRPKAMEEINEHNKNGVVVVIVSASPKNWILKWAETIGAEVISTELESKDGLLTGNILGKNCHRHEKVRLIHARYALKEYSEIYAYGDTNGDRPMLGLADYSYFKPFR
jgi:HAD superfamily hydrolase (TIGR01490 family)